jgi:hypothetical protein
MMTTSRRLVEVGARLEKAVMTIPGEVSNPLELYECYERSAIAILDSEVHLYEENELLNYLQNYLQSKRRGLGVTFLDP